MYVTLSLDSVCLLSRLIVMRELATHPPFTRRTDSALDTLPLVERLWSLLRCVCVLCVCCACVVCVLCGCVCVCVVCECVWVCVSVSVLCVLCVWRSGSNLYRGIIIFYTD